MRKRFALLFMALACTSFIYAGFAEKWKETFGEADQGKLLDGCFEVFFLKQYVAPGPDPKTAKPTDINMKDLTPEKFERIKEEVVRSEKEFKEATKKVEKLKEEFDEESLEYAEQRLKNATIQYERAKVNLKAAEEYIKDQKAKAMGKKRKSQAPEKRLRIWPIRRNISA